VENLKCISEKFEEFSSKTYAGGLSVSLWVGIFAMGYATNYKFAYTAQKMIQEQEEL